MLLPARMMRLTVIALERDQRALLAGLGHLGVAQLTSTAVPEGLKSRNVNEQLARCDSLLGRVAELRRSLEIAPQIAPTIDVAQSALENDERALNPIEQKVRQLLDKQKTLQERLRQLESEACRLSTFSTLGVPLDRLQESPFLHFVTGSVPVENLHSGQESLAGQAVLIPLAGSQNNVIAIGTRQNRPDWEQKLHQLGFRSAEPFLTGIRGEQGRQQMNEELTRLTASLRGVREETSRTVLEIENRTNLEKLLLSAEQTLGCTASTVVLTGWTPAVKAGLLEDRVREITHGRCFIDLTAPMGVAEKDIPVLFQPSNLLRPFQRLVAAYGLPNYREIEPSLFVALTYLVMFGMMFGDAGHGLVLVLLGFTVLVKGQKSGTRDWGALLIWVGLSSIVFGVFYGGYFGIPQLRRYALWHDPLEGSPTRLLLAAVGVGVVTISLGLLLNVINRLRHRDLSGGLLGEFGFLGIAFYWGTLALVAKAAVAQSGKSIGVASLVIVALPVAGWIVKELIGSRDDKQRGLTFATALVGAFEAVLVYFANTVSFVRLAAYAMSHAALLVATFAIAAEVSRLSHVGSALSIAIIIIGNAVAIGLEGVIAGVQALRLEFYEFFSKFFSAEGKPFKPFRLMESE